MTKQEYQIYLQSPHWRATRLAKLTQCGHKCESCKSGSGLQVHHLTYKRIGGEEMGDLMLLCDRCHNFAHLLWKRVPTSFPVAWQRALLHHFLCYCRDIGNPQRKNRKNRAKVNHAHNKLPMKARLFLKESKIEFLKANHPR